jgi:hypothetical protein
MWPLAKKRLDAHALYLKPAPPLPLPIDVRPVSWTWPPVLFLQSLLCVAAMQQFFTLTNLVASFHTSSSPLSLGFTVAFLPPTLHSKTRFGILLLNILTRRPANFNLLNLYCKLSQGYHVLKNHARDNSDHIMKNLRFNVSNTNRPRGLQQCDN